MEWTLWGRILGIAVAGVVSSSAFIIGRVLRTVRDSADLSSPIWSTLRLVNTGGFVEHAFASFGVAQIVWLAPWLLVCFGVAVPRAYFLVVPSLISFGFACYYEVCQASELHRTPSPLVHLQWHQISAAGVGAALFVIFEVRMHWPTLMKRGTRWSRLPDNVD